MTKRDYNTSLLILTILLSCLFVAIRGIGQVAGWW